MHTIITRYMHTNSTLGVSAGAPTGSGLHIYNDTGKLVLRKPDGRAPADTFTVPKALDAINCLAKLGGTLISYDSHGANHQLHFGRLDTGLEIALHGLHIYHDIRKLVLRKPDDRAPADTSTLPKALDAINSPSKARGHSHLSCLSWSKFQPQVIA